MNLIHFGPHIKATCMLMKGPQFKPKSNEIKWKSKVFSQNQKIVIDKIWHACIDWYELCLLETMLIVLRWLDEPDS